MQHFAVNGAPRRQSRFSSSKKLRRMPFAPRAISIAMAALLAGAAHSAVADEATLPEVRVQGQAESADGPVKGYRATRSSTLC